MAEPQHGTRARYNGCTTRDPCRCERCVDGYNVYQKMWQRTKDTPRNWQLHDDKIDTLLEILAGP